MSIRIGTIRIGNETIGATPAPKVSNGFTTPVVNPYDIEPSGTRNGKVNKWVRAAKNRSGIYYIFESTPYNLVYVGSSEGDLYRTILDHFASGHEMRESNYRDRLKKNDYFVSIKFLSKAETRKKEEEEICRLSPRDNRANNYSNKPSKGECKKARYDEVPF